MMHIPGWGDEVTGEIYFPVHLFRGFLVSQNEHVVYVVAG